MFSKRTIDTLTLLILLMAGLAGCQAKVSDSEEEEKPVELSGELRCAVEFQLWEAITGDFRDGVFRGVSFGDTREKVQITETFEPFEELAEQLGYTHDTKELETVDVYYHFSGNDEVDQIVVDVFLNGKTSVDRLWSIADWHFVSEYGEPVESADQKKVWISKGTSVTLESVSSGLDNGLKMKFVPAQKEAIALRGVRNKSGTTL